MAKGKAKRYTAEQKKEILNYIESQGRGGLTSAVKKYKVTAATISNWKKAAGGWISSGKTKGGSKELKALQELTKLLTEIEATEKKLAGLQKRYKQAKKKV